MDWKLEVVVVPVSDVDRAKQFYSEQVGFNVDVDHRTGEQFRVVQLTPPGSACSVTIGKGLSDMPPGSVKGLQLVVADIEAARAELVERGVEVSPIQHFDDGIQKEGPGGDWNSFIFFSDPDGNGWTVQQRPAQS
jgi:catechol 2,3-dioxygenase-like lactoylglutathione lyase family enzyme